jgi:hypothetical protein
MQDANPILFYCTTNQTVPLKPALNHASALINIIELNFIEVLFLP